MDKHPYREDANTSSFQSESFACLASSSKHNSLGCYMLRRLLHKVYEARDKVNIKSKSVLVFQPQFLTIGNELNGAIFVGSIDFFPA